MLCYLNVCFKQLCKEEHQHTTSPFLLFFKKKKQVYKTENIISIC